MARETIGPLEQLLMLAVARLGDEAYGVEIQKTLEETAGRSAIIATIYVTLVRLEKKGYVQSRREGPTPNHAIREWRATRKASPWAAICAKRQAGNHRAFSLLR